jgi:hypothetical protein
MNIDETRRKELVRYARDKNARQSSFSAAAPCEWRPFEVLNPETGIPFNDVSAWNFLADLLENGHQCETIVLDKPQGQIGYVVLVAGYEPKSTIYIKVSLSKNKINGRSFHLSIY